MSGEVLSFANELFRADDRRVQWFGERVLGVLRTAAPARILDIGCGDGSLLLYLAHQMPHAAFVGVDISAACIAAAKAAVDQHSVQSRIALIQSDFQSLDAGRFGAIVAYGSLQFMPGPVDALAAALARCVVPGGHLIHVTPDVCGFNTALNAIRAALRPMRTRALDAMILAAAGLLHRDEPQVRLRQSLDYMYRPARIDSDALQAALERHRFRLVATEAVPHASLGQFKHRLVVMSAPRT